jgi:chemotaxis protein MotA
MDYMTILGVVAGAGTIYYVMSAGNILGMLFDPLSAILVFGGTISATLIAFPWEIIRQALPSARLVLFPRKDADDDRQHLVNLVVSLAEKARRINIESIQDDMPKIDNKFLRYGLQMVIDGMEPAVVREHMEKEILYTRQRHEKVCSVFRTMASLAPIFGLLGTLIGVVQVLRNLSDPENMGRGMAVAITTTFYGIFAANFVFIPVDIKLNEHSQRDMIGRELIMEGVLAIQQGDLPVVVRQKLNAYLSFQTRKKTARKNETPA